ncbi:hypothetical protein GCM10017752_24290 [Streptomyces roseoviridis]
MRLSDKRRLVLVTTEGQTPFEDPCEGGVRRLHGRRSRCRGGMGPGSGHDARAERRPSASSVRVLHGRPGAKGLPGGGLRAAHFTGDMPSRTRRHAMAYDGVFMNGG